MYYRRCSFKDPRQFESLKKYFYRELNFLFGKVVENTDSYILGTVNMLSDEDNFEGKCAPLGVERLAMGDSKIQSALDDIGISYYEEKNMNESVSSKFFESVYANAKHFSEDGHSWSNAAYSAKHANDPVTGGKQLVPDSVTNVRDLAYAFSSTDGMLVFLSPEYLIQIEYNYDGDVKTIGFTLPFNESDSEFKELKDYMKSTAISKRMINLSSDNAKNLVIFAPKGAGHASLEKLFEETGNEITNGYSKGISEDAVAKIKVDARTDLAAVCKPINPRNNPFGELDPDFFVGGNN